MFRITNILLAVGKWRGRQWPYIDIWTVCDICEWIKQTEGIEGRDGIITTLSSICFNLTWKKQVDLISLFLIYTFVQTYFGHSLLHLPGIKENKSFDYSIFI